MDAGIAGALQLYDEIMELVGDQEVSHFLTILTCDACCPTLDN